MNNDEETFMYGAGLFDDEPAQMAAELREKIARGDFSTLRGRLKARWTLWRLERQVDILTADTPEGLARRQTKAAERSALAASIAIGVSLVSLAISLVALQKP